VAQCAGKVLASSWSCTIRTLATILVSLLIATALATVLYAIILSLGREPLPGAETRFTAPKLEQPTAPQRLPPIPQIQASATAATQPLDETRIRVAIQVENMTSSAQAQDAGVATFHTETGGDFQWLPLSATNADPDGAHRMQVDTAPGIPLTVTLSTSREYARHGYISRQIINLDQAAEATEPIVKLNGCMHRVQINLPTNAERAGPLRLKRTDDPRWLPILNSSSGLTLQRGVETILQLAPGTYELQDPLASDRSQTFTVTDSTIVEVSPTLAPAEGGRP
jgi:hypothetical protein